MKKTLLGAAVLAAMAGTAQAETSVTLYGLIDTGIGYQRIKGGDDHQSKFGMANGVSSGSRWGLRGSEDLGDGLSAVFVLESGFNSANGQSGQNSRLFGRQATVGLKSSSWGQLDFGRQTNIASKYFGAIDPFGASYGQANIGNAFSAANTVRYDNMVMYQTPSFSGFQFGAGYSFNVADTTAAQTGFATADNTRGITAGARYVNGPLNVALSYDQLNLSNNVDTEATPKQWIVGASYDFEVLKLALAFSQTRDGWFGGQGINAFGSGTASAAGFGSNVAADGFRANSYLVGLSLPIGGASNLLASWQRSAPKNDKLNGDDATLNVFSIGYTYDLSKRTNLYALGSYAKNFAFQEDVKSTVAIVGVRHRF
ncbi:MAG: porin [Bordetella sp.]|nr:porin [Bordetella sp.]